MSRQLGNYLIFAMYFSRPKNSFRQRFFHRSAAHENDGHLVKERPTRADRKVVSSSGECQEFLEQPKTHKKTSSKNNLLSHSAPTEMECNDRRAKSTQLQWSGMFCYFFWCVRCEKRNFLRVSFIYPRQGDIRWHGEVDDCAG